MTSHVIPPIRQRHGVAAHDMDMTDNTIARVQSGVPAGGEFAAHTRPADDILLSNPSPTSESYSAALDYYWEAQRKMREASIEEMSRLMKASPSVRSVTLDMDYDDPARLTVVSMLDAEGNEVEQGDPADIVGDDESLYDTLNRIAADMEFASWDEAKSMLFRNDTLDRFVVKA